MNKDSLKYYMPNYDSADEECKSNPVGYIIITNIDINTFDFLILYSASYYRFL